MKRGLAGLGAIVLTSVLVGCSSLPKLEQGDKLALVSFTLEKSITRTGEGPTGGPLLASSVADFYRYQQESLDQSWAEFKARSGEILAGRPFVDWATIEGNPAVLAITAASSNQAVLHPEGLNWANLASPSVARALATEVKAEVLVSVSLKASYELSTHGAVGSMGTNPARLVLSATLSAVRADGTELGRTSVSAASWETSEMQLFGDRGSRLPKEDYPRLFRSATTELFPRLKAELARW